MIKFTSEDIKLLNNATKLYLDYKDFYDTNYAILDEYQIRDIKQIGEKLLHKIEDTSQGYSEFWSLQLETNVYKKKLNVLKKEI